jgi:polysaccharide pyruvyl transferase WcaK-like protein
VKNRILVYGMHGYRNLGAESRLVAIIHHLHRIAPDAEVVTNTLHKTALDYLHDTATVRYFHPATYRRAGRRLIEDSDVLILSEGAFIGDRFTPHLVTAAVTAIEQAQASGAASVGLALDSNYLSPKRRARTARALYGISLLTVRAPGAERDLAALGVEVAMPVTADCAVSMPLPDGAVRDAAIRRWALDDGPVHGIAPVDFYMWPALLRPVGRPADYVRWPYKATWPDGGRERTAHLVEQWAEHARYLLGSHPRARVAIFVMDRGDLRIADQVHAAIGVPERTVVVNGQESHPQEMSAAYGQLASLTSSRYHALVLSAAYAIPQVALGHDNRTRFFLDDMGLSRFFVANDDPAIAASLRARHAQMMAERDEVRGRLAHGFKQMVARDALNYRLLGDLLADVGYRVEADAAAPDALAASAAGDGPGKHS